MEEKIMTGEREKAKLDYIAGVLCAILAIMNMIFYYNWQNAVNLILWAAVAVGLFIKKGDLVVVTGVGGMIVKAIIVSIYYHLGGIANVLSIMVMILTFTYLAAMCIPSFKNFVSIAEQYWFRIGIVHIILGAYNILLYLMNIAKYGFYTVLDMLLFIGSTIITSVTFYILLAAKCKPVKNYDETKMTDGAQSVLADDEWKKKGYCSMATHILLLLFTCGIYMFVWIYRTTDNLNVIEDEEKRNPTTKLLLCMFVPFYSIYWTYVSAKRIEKLSRMCGREVSLVTECVIAAVFIAIVPPILMQSEINNIAKIENITY